MDERETVAPKHRRERRSQRKRVVRARTINVRRLSRRDLAVGRIMYPDPGVDRPSRRAECERGPRPCPFVSCKYHLYLDVSPTTGAIKLNFPDLEVWELARSCALDVADEGATSVEATSNVLNLTRERIRQIEVVALSKLEASVDLRELRDVAA